MPEVDIENYFDAIDDARVQRVRELSEIKYMFSSTDRNDPLSVHSKAVVVLTYANWEAFYNECVGIYVSFLEAMDILVSEASWLLLTGALSAEFESLRSRNDSRKARREFVASLKTRMVCKFDEFDRTAVMARSNLDFDKLSENLLLLDFDAAPLQRSRIRLNKELVGWRHRVAHGDPPDLSTVDIADHINFAADMMLVVSDLFQDAILARA